MLGSTEPTNWARSSGTFIFKIASKSATACGRTTSDHRLPLGVSTWTNGRKLASSVSVKVTAASLPMASSHASGATRWPEMSST